MNTMFDTRRSPSPRTDRGPNDLLDDLARGQVPFEPRLAGGAEPTSHGAPGLARDADRDAIAVRHEHGLDGAVVVQTPKELHGGATVAHPFGDELERRRQLGGEPMSQRLRQVGHLLRCEQSLVQPVPHLPRSVRGLAVEESLERVETNVVAGGHGLRLRAMVAPDPRPQLAPRPEHHHRDVRSGSARAAVFGVSDGLVSNVSLILGVAGAESRRGGRAARRSGGTHRGRGVDGSG